MIPWPLLPVRHRRSIKSNFVRQFASADGYTTEGHLASLVGRPIPERIREVVSEYSYQSDHQPEDSAARKAPGPPTKATQLGTNSAVCYARSSKPSASSISTARLTRG